MAHLKTGEKLSKIGVSVRGNDGADHRDHQIFTGKTHQSAVSPQKNTGKCGKLALMLMILLTIWLLIL